MTTKPRTARLTPLRRLSARVLDALAFSYRFNISWREANRDLICGQFAERPAELSYAPPPAQYECVSTSTELASTRQDGARPLFITARFRSGSTLLWNIFRHTPGLTAYYEPLNERRWFAGGKDADETDQTHVNATRYGQEYAGFGDLEQWFTAEWTYRNLYMDEKSCDRRLARYLLELIRRAPTRPVLQCNRLDFRLPWLRATFHDADVLLLYRNPREQWMSVQRSSSGAPPSRRLTPNESEDYFYTLAWARDLRRVFPFLDLREHAHAYSVHYLLWRLSYLFGQKYADGAISYEELVSDCSGVLRPIFQRFDINEGEMPAGAYADLLKAPEPERWRSYASACWFADIEAECELELKRFLGGS